ncbi:argonaute/piwi family protein [Hydrotalea lipotrueae]|uniref:hypothetical protein n=1 Tax=Hydrotalea lipotrueae TaxID=2803817 RepID=UPI001C45D492|nr:hypothetical protein [Hydrotalea lipotrueae]
MKKEFISLNFIEFNPKKFDAVFYCQKLDLIPDENRRNYYIRNLKPSDDANKFEKFAIVFEAQEGFERKVISHTENIDITKRLIFYNLKKLLRTKGIKDIEVNKDKYHRIYLPIEKHNEGVETIWIEPYFLKQTNSFGILIDFKFLVSQEYKKSLSSPVDKRILQLSGTLDSRGNSNKAFYQFKFEKLKKFFSQYYQPLSSIHIGEVNFQLSQSLTEISAHSLNPKIYQFQNDVENASPYFGLQKNKPYQNPEKETNFLFVFKDIDRNIAINLLNGLKGITSPNTFSGIESLFKIPFNNDCIKGKKVVELSLEVLNSIVEEIKIEKEKGKNVLPIFITNSRVNQADDKLYFLIKHTFTKNNIPCQVVTKDLISNTKSLSWSLSNIGLQIFAKAGGKPWKVKPAIKEGLIIGIGSKNKEAFITDENGFTRKKIEKYLTYSVLTDSSGLFKEIQILSETDNEADYYKTLITKLTTIIEQAVKDGYKDIVIHIPFRISKEKVWDVIFKKISNDINVSVILINSDHKYFGYDLSKNALVPYESTFITLSEYEYLVWFEGLQYNNAPFSKPIGSPIYIDFWYSNTKTLLQNISYRKSLLQDCINLSGANWRGFKAKQLPVSIFYCQKIADFLKKFEDYELEHIEFENLKPWFL